MIALTANAVEGAKEKYLKEGFIDYLSKPIEVDKLEEILRKYLPEYMISETDKDADTDSSDGVVMMEFSPQNEEEDDSSEDINNSMLEGLRDIGIAVEDGIKYCGDSVDFYVEILRDYADACSAKSEELGNYYLEQDWQAYRILIHSLKSTSKSIGAELLFGLAAKLEEAAINEDDIYIMENHEKFIRIYSQTTKAIGEILR